MVSAAVLLLNICMIYAQYSMDGNFPFPSSRSGYNQNFIDVISKLTADGDSELISNTTSVSGTDVVLSCRVTGKAEAVVWMDKYDNVLYYNEERIIDDERFILLQPDDSQWNLQIKDLSARDGGRYRCITNTDPILITYYDLIVQIPARIDRLQSSNDIMAREGSNVSLICNATGFPEPTLSWSVHKADAQASQSEVLAETKDIHIVYNVRRYTDDIYTCTARNIDGHSDSHSMRVRVRFAPTVTLRNKNGQSQDVGKSTVLTCTISGFPLGETFWTGPPSGRRINATGSLKYEYDVIDRRNKWGREMNLYVNNIQSEDYGQYRCVASSIMGTAEAAMELSSGPFEQYEASTGFYTPTTLLYSNDNPLIPTILDARGRETTTYPPYKTQTMRRTTAKPKVQLNPPKQRTRLPAPRLQSGNTKNKAALCISSTLTMAVVTTVTSLQILSLYH